MNETAPSGAEPAKESSSRLAVYVSLAPGRANHGQLDGLAGRWIAGTVRGDLHDRGWGAGLGYPGLVLDPNGPIVEVLVFESPDLPGHWSRLDEFEGPGYRRVITTVTTAGGDLAASIYVLARTGGRDPGAPTLGT